MNSLQKKIILIGLLIFVLAVIFPPMRYSTKSHYDYLSNSYWYRTDVEYSFIGSGVGDLLVTRLLVEILSIIFVTGVLIYLTSSKKE